MEQVSVRLCIQVHKKAWFPLYNEINRVFRYGVLDQVDERVGNQIWNQLHSRFFDRVKTNIKL